MRVRPVAIIWCAVALHVMWGCLLLFDGRVLGATALSAFADVPRFVMAGVFFLVAALAVVGVTRRHGTWLSLALLLPQQAVLTVSAVSAVMAVIHSEYGDGVARPWHFILADQAPVILTVVLHTIAVVQLHLPRPPDVALQTAVDTVQNEASRLRGLLSHKLAQHDKDG
jgi:hypothetical protein